MNCTDVPVGTVTDAYTLHSQTVCENVACLSGVGCIADPMPCWANLPAAHGLIINCTVDSVLFPVAVVVLAEGAVAGA